MQPDQTATEFPQSQPLLATPLAGVSERAAHGQIACAGDVLLRVVIRAGAISHGRRRRFIAARSGPSLMYVGRRTDGS
jgi:hypothetical protein